MLNTNRISEKPVVSTGTTARLLSGSRVPRPTANGPAVLGRGDTGDQQQLSVGMHQEGDAVVFWWQGKRTAVTRDHNGLLLEHLPESSCLPWCAGDHAATVRYVPYSEILCCRYLPVRRYCSGLSPCQRKQRHYMELQVLARHPSRPWLWSINHLELAAEQPDLIKAWVQHTRQQLRALSYRPQQLLVFVNPYGGKRQARRTWARHAEPILTAAGVSYDLVETQYQGHAEEYVRGLSLEQLQGLDGIVAVGGDGLFAELLTAVLQHKHLTAALQLRLGHIPAGSTDAVACTLHGTRDAVTAALHIALGDCTALDVGRMETLPPAQQQQQPAGALHAAADHVQEHSATQLAGKQQSAGVWDGGMSAGSQSELLVSAGDVPSVGTGAHASEQAVAGAAAVAGSSSSSVQDGRKQREQRWRRRKQAQKQPAAQPLQQQQQQDVTLHIPQLRHFVCVANYGFLGDVMEMSEKLRWCGPMRYDLAGSLRFLMLRQYKATVWYKPAPLHEDESAAEHTAAAAATGHQQQTPGHRRLGSDTIVSPAAVLPLPHHRAPALHAKVSHPGSSRLTWQQQQEQGPMQQQQQQPDMDEHDGHCCAHTIASHLLHGSSHCSSESGSRRSSMDFSSGPLVTVLEGIGADGGLVDAAGPAPALTAAAAPARGAGDCSSAAAALGATGYTTPPMTPGGSAVTSCMASPTDMTGKHQQQQQQQGKSVRFLPQMTAAVHASPASFSSSSRSSLGGFAGLAAAVGVTTSRASSVTSQSSRCHSRCSRCSAAAMHRSNSRQSFVSAAAAPESAPPSAAAAAAAPGASSTGSDTGRRSASDTADGVVQVTHVVPSLVPDAACSIAAGAAPASAAAAAAAAGGPPGPGWVKVEGEFASIMCVVTSCISDKSRQGLMPDAHLADGRLVLVMVQKCSRLQYLRFLVQLATKGIVPGSLPFVRTEFATEVHVDAKGRPSSWNVDGELLRHGRVNVGIHAGLVDVFARGVELM